VLAGVHQSWFVKKCFNHEFWYLEDCWWLLVGFQTLFDILIQGWRDVACARVFAFVEVYYYECRCNPYDRPQESLRNWTQYWVLRREKDRWILKPTWKTDYVSQHNNFSTSSDDYWIKGYNQKTNKLVRQILRAVSVIACNYELSQRLSCIWWI
jgi:hypothetical protein